MNRSFDFEYFLEDTLVLAVDEIYCAVIYFAVQERKSGWRTSVKTCRPRSVQQGENELIIWIRNMITDPRTHLVCFNS